MLHMVVTRSIELTEETYEGERVIKVTFFEGGMDVAMYRYDTLSTALNAIKQWWVGGRRGSE